MAELEVAWRLFQWQRANGGAACKIDDDQREFARLLRRDVSDLSVRTDRNRMRLGHGHGCDDRLARRVDQRDAVLTINADQQQLAVRRHREAVWRFTDFNFAYHAIGRGVDDAQLR